MRYLAHRFLQSCLVLAGVSVLTFLFVGLAPGNFLDEMRLNPQISSESLARLRSQYEIDQPLPARYFRWARSVAKGEWGYSFSYNTPVAPLIMARARNTLLLTGSATLLTWLIALPLGIISAESRRGWIDRITSFVTNILLATPDLLLALSLLLLAVHTRWLPAGGMESLRAGHLAGWAKFKDTASHFVAPVIVLVLGSLPTLFRHTRAAMTEALESPYIRSARAHGLRRWRIILRHVLPVAANPLISFFGLYVGWLLSASLLVEVVMSWPGLGPLLLEAILGRDIYVVVGAVMFSSIFLLLGAMLSDALLYAVDPRIRTKKVA